MPTAVGKKKGKATAKAAPAPKAAAKGPVAAKAVQADAGPSLESLLVDGGAVGRLAVATQVALATALGVRMSLCPDCGDTDDDNVAKKSVLASSLPASATIPLLVALAVTRGTPSWLAAAATTALCALLPGKQALVEQAVTAAVCAQRGEREATSAWPADAPLWAAPAPLSISPSLVRRLLTALPPSALSLSLSLTRSAVPERDSKRRCTDAGGHLAHLVQQHPLALTLSLLTPTLAPQSPLQATAALEQSLGPFNDQQQFFVEERRSDFPWLLAGSVAAEDRHELARVVEQALGDAVSLVQGWTDSLPPPTSLSRTLGTVADSPLFSFDHPATQALSLTVTRCARAIHGLFGAARRQPARAAPAGATVAWALLTCRIVTHLDFLGSVTFPAVALRRSADLALASISRACASTGKKEDAQTTAGRERQSVCDRLADALAARTDPVAAADLLVAARETTVKVSVDPAFFVTCWPLLRRLVEHPMAHPQGRDIALDMLEDASTATVASDTPLLSLLPVSSLLAALAACIGGGAPPASSERAARLAAAAAAAQPAVALPAVAATLLGANSSLARQSLVEAASAAADSLPDDSPSVGTVASLAGLYIAQWDEASALAAAAHDVWTRLPIDQDIGSDDGDALTRLEAWFDSFLFGETSCSVVSATAAADALASRAQEVGRGKELFGRLRDRLRSLVPQSAEDRAATVAQLAAMDEANTTAARQRALLVRALGAIALRVGGAQCLLFVTELVLPTGPKAKWLGSLADPAEIVRTASADALSRVIRGADSLPLLSLLTTSLRSTRSLSGAVDLAPVAPFASHLFALKQLLDTLPAGDAATGAAEVQAGLLAALGAGRQPLVASTIAPAASAVAERIQVTRKKGVRAGNEDDVVAAKSFATALMSAVRSCDDRPLQEVLAFTFAGSLRGLGFASLKTFDVPSMVARAANDRRNVHSRVGAAITIRALAVTFGRLVEPQCAALLQPLMRLSGEAVNAVRSEAARASSALLAILSPQGVRFVLPILVKGGKSKSKEWRTKAAALTLMGSLAHCQPTALASALQTVLPVLRTAMVEDIEYEVQDAARASLEALTSVVRSPELSSLVPSILRAYEEADAAPRVLKQLLATRFVHVMDGPSLGMLMPVLQVGLDADSASETKKSAAAVCGTMVRLTESPQVATDFCVTLYPLVAALLADPIPAVRTTGASALGSISRSLPKEHLTKLLKNLRKTLQHDNAPLVRSGASQGVAHLLLGDFFDEDGRREAELKWFVTQMTPTADGVISFWLHAPPVLTPRRIPTPIVADALVALLETASETVDEAARDMAHRAGMSLVTTFAKACGSMLLGILEVRLTDHRWRGRYAAISLTAELLLAVAGTRDMVGQLNFLEAEAAKLQETLVVSSDEESDDDGDDGDDDGDGGSLGSSMTVSDAYDASVATEAALAKMDPALMRRLLSSVYVSRFDPQPQCASAGMTAWKAIVSNTPRTLRDILPVAVRYIATLLQDEGGICEALGVRALTDMQAKLGERVIPTILPMLQGGAGLVVICDRAPQAALASNHGLLLRALKHGLSVDSSSNTSTALDILVRRVGKHVLDDILNSMGNDTRGLLAVLEARPSVTLPRMLPRLIDLQEHRVLDLEMLVKVVASSGTAFARFASEVMRTLVLAGADEEQVLDEDLVRQLLLALDSDMPLEEATGAIIAGIEGEIAPRYPVRCSACRLFRLLVEGRGEATTTDIAEYIEAALRALVMTVCKTDPTLRASAEAALTALLDVIPAEAQPACLPALHDSLCDLQGDLSPTILKPLVSVAVKGVLSGIVTGAKVLELLVAHCDAASFKPLCVSVLGPLIRVSGDRASSVNLRTTTLAALGAATVRGGAGVRAFVSQIQSTLVRAIGDVARDVRRAGVDALAVVLAAGTVVPVKYGPLILSLGTLLKAEGPTDKGAVSSLVAALQACPTSLSAGTEAESKVVTATTELPRDLVQVHGALLRHLPPGDRLERLTEWLSTAQAETLAWALHYSPKVVKDVVPLAQLASVAVEAGSLCLAYEVFLADSDQDCLDLLCTTVESGAQQDERLAALGYLRRIARRAFRARTATGSASSGPTVTPEQCSAMVLAAARAAKPKSTRFFKFESLRTLFTVDSLISLPRTLTDGAQLRVVEEMLQKARAEECAVDVEDSEGE